jgi:hypothetical protein
VGRTFLIAKSSSACRRPIRLSVLVARLNAPSPVKSGCCTHPDRYPSTAWTRSRWAHLHFMRHHPVVLLPLLRRKIVAIPKVVHPMDFQAVEIAEGLTAFDID